MKKILFLGMVILYLFIYQSTAFALFPIATENNYRERLRSFLSWDINDKCQISLNKVKINMQGAQKGDMIYLPPSLSPSGGNYGVRGYGITWKIKLD